MFIEGLCNQGKKWQVLYNVLDAFVRESVRKGDPAARQVAIQVGNAVQISFAQKRTERTVYGNDIDCGRGTIKKLGDILGTQTEILGEKFKSCSFYLCPPEASDWR